MVKSRSVPRAPVGNPTAARTATPALSQIGAESISPPPRRRHDGGRNPGNQTTRRPGPGSVGPAGADPLTQPTRSVPPINRAFRDPWLASLTQERRPGGAIKSRLGLDLFYVARPRDRNSPLVTCGAELLTTTRLGPHRFPAQRGKLPPPTTLGAGARSRGMIDFRPQVAHLAGAMSAPPAAVA